MSNAQASFEYLAVLALTLVILIPSVYIFYNQSRMSKEEVVDSQINSIGKEIIDNAKFVHYSGEGSKITLDVEIPSGVDSIYVVGGRELVFDLDLSIGKTQVVFFSEIAELEMTPLESPFGAMRIEILAYIDASKSYKVKLVKK